ncbi:GH36-type glycosyl hydrolase domain-containing protein [Gracilibacillus alcaliphilus]|uniref:GH36-type glycosyl hydrolase domain-containing protein n=1 Tax=Gracilibacillus alcaliphilus TaxID=1401441 RepID=UPI00195BAD5F|nr:cellobiose phosphorylase [Gracilibacillus alcaliphilus]
MTVQPIQTITSDSLAVSVLSSGDIYHIKHQETLINQVLSNSLDGSLQNIYLRVFQADDTPVIAPLLGVQSNSTFLLGNNKAKWTGRFAGVDYEVIFHLHSSTWFWEVNLNGANQQADLIYGQDVGLASQGAVQSNESYVSQYIDYQVFEDKQQGYVVCARQNQSQDGQHPYLQQGALGKTTSYSTDGFQFFGLSYKTTNQPEALANKQLANCIYQYEFAYTALQSERFTLDGEQQFVFYGHFQADHPDAVTELAFTETIQQAWLTVSKQQTTYETKPTMTWLEEFAEPLQTDPMTIDEITSYFPNRKLEEYQEDQLLSFFTDTHEHIVLKEKEQLLERPHGHILLSGNNEKVRDDVFTSTSYIYGIFNSQVSAGNVELNKWMTNSRNSLNRFKTSGQRIYIKLDDHYQLLTMPSLFEIGFNYVRWYYKTNTDTIIVTNFTMVDQQQVQLRVESKSGQAYPYLLTQQLTESFFSTAKIEGEKLYFAKEQAEQEIYPELHYQMTITGSEVMFHDEGRLVSNAQSGEASLLVAELTATKQFTVVLQGDVRKPMPSLDIADFEQEAERYRAFYQQLLRGFQLKIEGTKQTAIEKLNTLAWWYTHNMLVHFSNPHGLEQYGGAAWGTRDVNQGPLEYFMATGNYQTVKEIIKSVYAHQYHDKGNWPQWFMFDQYTSIQQEESHGDIIVWPLKVIGDYLEATGDTSLLEEKLPYVDRHSKHFTKQTYSLWHHLEKQMEYVKQNFLHGTHLPAYDDGDWDDTLQPANPAFKTNMVSSWTTALLYQSLTKLATIGAQHGYQQAAQWNELAQVIKQDVQTYMLDDEVMPGFIYMEDTAHPEKILHPSDQRTGIQYRLLPMQRGIISELFTKEQAESHYQLIRNKLYFPDGVRLMSQPAPYNGGVSTHFKRAEQASNFGREIGLQYVHAHIRFIEAMAKLGKPEEVWRGLAVINPIGIQEVVANAELRQSNAYFSSSDGNFATRYQAAEAFDKLRTGDVTVKGGWRIYSSGPGIYLNQLISNALGIREMPDYVIIDPVIETDLDGLQFEFQCLNKPVTFVYHTGASQRKVIVNGQDIQTTNLENPYRKGGFRLDKADLAEILKADGSNLVHVYL